MFSGVRIATCFSGVRIATCFSEVRIATCFSGVRIATCFSGVRIATYQPLLVFLSLFRFDVAWSLRLTASGYHFAIFKIFLSS